MALTKSIAGMQRAPRPGGSLREPAWHRSRLQRRPDSALKKSPAAVLALVLSVVPGAALAQSRHPAPAAKPKGPKGRAVGPAKGAPKVGARVTAGASEENEPPPEPETQSQSAYEGPFTWSNAPTLAHLWGKFRKPKYKEPFAKTPVGTWVPVAFVGHMGIDRSRLGTTGPRLDVRPTAWFSFDGGFGIGDAGTQWGWGARVRVIPLFPETALSVGVATSGGPANRRGSCSIFSSQACGRLEQEWSWVAWRSLEVSFEAAARKRFYWRGHVGFSVPYGDYEKRCTSGCEGDRTIPPRFYLGVALGISLIDVLDGNFFR